MLHLPVEKSIWNTALSVESWTLGEVVNAESVGVIKVVQARLTGDK